MTFVSSLYRKNYKYVKRDRVFPSDAIVAASGPLSSKPEGNQPLSGWKIAIIGNPRTPKTALTKAIMDLGATVVNTIDKNTAACISTEGEVYTSY